MSFSFSIAAQPELPNIVMIVGRLRGGGAGVARGIGRAVRGAATRVRAAFGGGGGTY